MDEHAADALIDDAIIIVEGIMNFITRRREKRKKATEVETEWVSRVTIH